jgi:hypothetical protein
VPAEEPASEALAEEADPGVRAENPESVAPVEQAAETTPAPESAPKAVTAASEPAPVPVAPAPVTEPEAMAQIPSDDEPRVEDAAPMAEAAEGAEADAIEAAEAEPETTETPGEEPGQAERVEAPPVLPGTLGYDSQGRPGHVHVVVPGDTLWDISDAYLGTPWVWPSIWNDNRDLEDPHLILPGDRIWITATEMRRVSPEEAAKLLANLPAAPLELINAGTGIGPEEFAIPTQGEPVWQTPVQQPDQPIRYPVAANEMVGLVAAERLESAASIVDAVTTRLMLSQEDPVYIGLGAGEVQVGEQFTIFRSGDRVIDPDTKRVLGYYVDVLGWLEVTENHRDTSTAVIRMATAEIERGDRIMPREPAPDTVELAPSPGDVEGKLSYFASGRTIMGQVDYVYLNRGTLDGLQVGSPLEVFRAPHDGIEYARGERVRVPAQVVAHLLVVKAEPETSVAFVAQTDVELELGDTFRGAR